MESKLQAINVIGLLRIPMIGVGLVGNLLSFIVFSRKAFQNNSISTYCRALAISDSYILYQFVFDITFTFFNTNMSTKSQFLCKLHFFIEIGLSTISIWILVVFSIDKMIHVLGKAQKFSFIKKKKFQLALVLSVAILSCLIYMFIPIMIQLTPVPIPGVNGTFRVEFFCILQTIANYKFLNGFILAESAILPFLLLTITTGFTVKRLFQSRNNLLQRAPNSTTTMLRERKSKDFKFAITSIVLNIIAVIFQIPISLSYLVTIENAIDYALFFMICFFLLYLNFSITFFIHLGFNSIFRNELFLMLGIRKPQIHPAGTNTNVNTRQSTRNIMRT
jgi:hypothetical protein